jgi:ketosteroid isomerase-like protein
MSEESTTPDLVELGRLLFSFASDRNLDAALRFYAPDAIFDARDVGGVFEGRAAIRHFWADWLDSYDTFEIVVEELLDLGHGVSFVALRQTARLVGSSSEVSLHEAWVASWLDGLIVRVTTYGDIDEARAAAERLAGRDSATDRSRPGAGR